MKTICDLCGAFNDSNANQCIHCNNGVQSEKWSWSLDDDYDWQRDVRLIEDAEKQGDVYRLEYVEGNFRILESMENKHIPQAIKDQVELRIPVVIETLTDEVKSNNIGTRGKEQRLSPRTSSSLRHTTESSRDHILSHKCSGLLKPEYVIRKGQSTADESHSDLKKSVKLSKATYNEEINTTLRSQRKRARAKSKLDLNDSQHGFSTEDTSNLTDGVVFENTSHLKSSNFSSPHRHRINDARTQRHFYNNSKKKKINTHETATRKPVNYNKKTIESSGPNKEPAMVDDRSTCRSLQGVDKNYYSLRGGKADGELWNLEREELATIPKQDDVVHVESANAGDNPHKKRYKISRAEEKIVKRTQRSASKMRDRLPVEKDVCRASLFESMKCPLCPYTSGIELEMVFHIRRSHPHYIGAHLCFHDCEEGSVLTRVIIFVQLWTFYECKACGKIHDRLCLHKTHITTHDRKCHKDIVNGHSASSTHSLEFSKANEPTQRDPFINSIGDIQTLAYCDVRKRILRRPSISLDPIKNIPKQQTSITTNTMSINKGHRLRAAAKSPAMKHTDCNEDKTKPIFKIPQQPVLRATVPNKNSNSKMIFMCKFCDRALKGFINWNKHLIQEHSIVEFESNLSTSLLFYECKKCYKNFENLSCYQLHSRLSHRRKNRIVEINGNDQEEICRQTTRPKINPKEQRLAKKSLKYRDCLTVTSFETALTTSALFCEYCGALFDTREKVQIHMLRHDTKSYVRRIIKVD